MKKKAGNGDLPLESLGNCAAVALEEQLKSSERERFPLVEMGRHAAVLCSAIW